MENKLISLASYLKKLSLKENEIPQDEEMFYYSFYRKANICADFYMQPLNIGMFFPVDKNGDFWDAPKYYGGSNALQNDFELIKFEEAKKKVLFEGFKLDKDGFYAYDDQKDLWIDEEFCEGLRIEDMVQYDLILTPIALKQLKDGTKKV